MMCEWRELVMYIVEDSMGRLGRLERSACVYITWYMGHSAIDLDFKKVSATF